MTVRGDQPGVGLVRSEQERVDPERTVSRAAMEGLDAFAYRYYALLAAGDDDRDIVFSPLSIATAGAMLHAGARGATAGQLATVFGLPGAETPTNYNALEQVLLGLDRATVHTANRIFPAARYPIEQAYVDQLVRYYGAGVERLDYGEADAAAGRINDWVGERTLGLIEDLVSADALDEETALVLVNALYLAAPWARPFADTATRNETFTRLDGEDVDVAMMHASRLNTRFAEGDGWQALEIPYDEPTLSMLVIVPAAGRFEEVEGQLGADFVAAIDEDGRDGVVDLSLPRWSSRRTDAELLAHLADLGFDAGGDTDFTGIGADNPILTAAVHAATIDVDENGTVAAAATAGLGVAGAAPQAPDVTIRADRPFVYLVRHNLSGAILFAGRVIDPSA